MLNNLKKQFNNPLEKVGVYFGPLVLLLGIIFMVVMFFILFRSDEDGRVFDFGDPIDRDAGDGRVVDDVTVPVPVKEYEPTLEPEAVATPVDTVVTLNQTHSVALRFPEPIDPSSAVIRTAPEVNLKAVSPPEDRNLLVFYPSNGDVWEYNTDYSIVVLSVNTTGNETLKEPYELKLRLQRPDPKDISVPY